MTDSLLDQEKLTTDSTKNYLEELVGENKKFKTPEDLARGKAESDAFIETMKSRMDELRSDYIKLKDETQKRASLEDLINQIKADRELASSEQPLAKEVIQPQIDPKDIESLFDKRIQEYEASKRGEENFNQIRTKLRERHGDKYSEVLKSQIDELGLTSDYVNTLARTNPSVFSRVFGLDQEQKREMYQAPPKGNVNTTTFKPKGPVQKTWQYYQDLRKADPTIYHSKKIANEMHDSAQALGEAFFDGDALADDKELLARVIT